jgi:hypothetical protein
MISKDWKYSNMNPKGLVWFLAVQIAMQAAESA